MRMSSNDSCDYYDRTHSNFLSLYVFNKWTAPPVIPRYSYIGEFKTSECSRIMLVYPDNIEFTISFNIKEILHVKFSLLVVQY